MANYNFTFNNGELTYKDADGNECSVGGGGGAVYNVPMTVDAFPAVSFNTISQHFENGDICLMRGLNAVVEMVVGTNVFDGKFYVKTLGITFFNTSPDASNGWDID